MKVCPKSLIILTKTETKILELLFFFPCINLITHLLSQVPGSVLMSSTAKPPLLACPSSVIVKDDLASTVNWAGVQFGRDES